MARVEAVLLAAVVNMIIGAVWYSSWLFGELWQKMIGLRQRELINIQGNAYRASFIAALIMSYVLAYLLQFTQVSTPAQGASAGFWLWLGLVFPTHLVTTAFSKRPALLLLIDSGYFLMALIGMGMTLTLI